MKINLHVEQHMLADENFQNKLLQVCTYLSLQNSVKNLCLHEAGHTIYFEPVRSLAGPDMPELEFVGPTIFFNSASGKFDYTIGAIDAPFHKYGIKYTEEILSYLAQGAVAGGVFLRELENEQDGGDSADMALFHTHFLLARDQGLMPRRNEEKMWDKAQTDVRMHLQDASFVKMVRAEAARIEAKHFSTQRDK
jgi:hypothetical protein